MTGVGRMTLRLAALLVLAPGSAGAAWLVESATLPDGSTTVWTTIDARESPQSGLGTDMPGRLVVACTGPPAPGAPGTPAVRLAWRPPVPLPTRVPIRYRVDGRAPAEALWTPEAAGDGVSQVGDEAVGLVAAVGPRTALAIEVDTVAEGTLLWSVDAGRAWPALVQVLAHCVGRPPSEDLTLEALAREWRTATRAVAEREARAHEARLDALRERQARIRDEAAARERALADYAEAVRRVIAGFWVVPDAARAPHGAIRAAISVDRAGRVMGAALETRSDDAALDWSVVSALDKAREAGLPPLPAAYQGERLDLVVTLDPASVARR